MMTLRDRLPAAIAKIAKLFGKEFATAFEKNAKGRDGFETIEIAEKFIKEKGGDVTRKVAQATKEPTIHERLAEQMRLNDELQLKCRTLEAAADAVKTMSEELTKAKAERDSAVAERDEMRSKIVEIETSVDARASRRALEIAAGQGIPMGELPKHLRGPVRDFDNLAAQYSAEKDPQKRAAIWEEIKKDLGLQ